MFSLRLILIAAAVAAFPLAQAAEAKTLEPDVPDDIRVEAGHKAFLQGHAVGVQIYSCNAAGGGYSWGPATPRADLYDDNGKLIATHFGGPTWLAKDGSSVVGKRDTQVTVDATAIPWLRLSAASTSSGEDGDRLAHTTFIQRIATVGGLAPAAGDCNPATVGNRVEVPYSADYVFWKATGH
jgi:hypothetical protein